MLSDEVVIGLNPLDEPVVADVQRDVLVVGQPQGSQAIRCVGDQAAVELLDPRSAFHQTQVPVDLQRADLRLAQVARGGVLVARIEKDLGDSRMGFVGVRGRAPTRDTLGEDLVQLGHRAEGSSARAMGTYL